MRSSVECFNWHAELSAVEALASARNFCPALPPGTVWWGGSDALTSRGLCAEDAVCRVHLKNGPYIVALYIPLYEALLIGMAVLIYIISAFHILLKS